MSGLQLASSVVSGQALGAYSDNVIWRGSASMCECDATGTLCSKFNLHSTSGFCVCLCIYLCMHIILVASVQ